MNPMALFVLVALAVGSTDGGRRKRDLNQFSHMIYSATGRDPFDFSDYGNWCGLGGNGTVVDAIDECCFHHDNCYDKIIHNPLCGNVYTIKYKSNTDNSKIECYDKTPCQRALCECDKKASMCFRDNGAVYNTTHKGVFAKVMSKLTKKFYK
uniref:Phospholipase A2 n=1 Tax=Crassostrea virginica TaxID=6565 RepID=A0A8B8ETA4_CRAVI|nr:acidic phospholipase A2-like [Crassostrea virginica]XP_022343152.1 acidic phospholipase A2-like [Crassostrea virginica]